MDSPIFRRKWSRSRMAANGLGIILFEYSDRLQGLGYSRDTIHQYTQAVEHFGFWRSQAFSRSRNVTASEVAEFLTSHLPICRCPPPASKTFRTCRAALHHLMLMVGCVSLDSSVRARLGPVTEAVARFDRYLEDVCGLGDATRLYRRRYAREFLEWRFKGKRFVTASLRLADFVRYVSHRTPALRPSSVSVMTVSLRSLVKFLEIEQECAIGLSRLWPKMPNFYRAAAEVLTERECRDLIRTADVKCSTGLRDLAILRIMLDLGLRCSEVAQLSLEDVDWREGTLAIRTNKQRRERVLPLPAPTGNAIAAYLRTGRPKSDSRQLLLCHRVPVGKPLSAVRSFSDGPNPANCHGCTICATRSPAVFWRSGNTGPPDRRTGSTGFPAISAMKALATHIGISQLLPRCSRLLRTSSNTPNHLDP